MNLTEKLEVAEKTIVELHVKLDKLLAHCPDGECLVCAAIICPHGEPMHFHHDGCPACAELGDISRGASDGC